MEAGLCWSVCEDTPPPMAGESERVCVCVEKGKEVQRGNVIERLKERGGVVEWGSTTGHSKGNSTT
jgi:hypothetical protein